MVPSPGTIKVDAITGRRFVDETLDYVYFGSVMRSKNIARAWVIADSLAVKRYGLGMAKPAPFSVKPWVRRGYIVEASSIAELATKIGLDPRSEEHTSELQSLMRISYAVFCLKKKKTSETHSLI